MPVRQAKYVPKHRNAPSEPAPAPSRWVTTLRRSVRYSGIAVAATGIAVTGGIAVSEQAPADPAAATIAAAQVEHDAQLDRSDAQLDRSDAQLDRSETQERETAVSRSDRRRPTDRKKSRDQASGGKASRTEASRTEDLASQDPKAVARKLMPEYGFSAAEFGCLDQLWISESDWDHTADNPTSSAYGIPQALTGGTHDNLPADYMTNPVSQIRWGLWYIRESYGTICSAWEFKQGNNWY